MQDRMPYEQTIPTIIGCFVLFSLFYYGYVYFYDFDEGVSSAPFGVKALKDIAYLCVAALLAVISWRAALLLPWTKSGLIFAPLGIALIISSLVHAPQTSLAEQLWENIKNVAIFIPLFSLPYLLSKRTRYEITSILFQIIVFAAFIQISLVLILHANKSELWQGGVYAGMIGNPNSFALLLNFAAAIILSRLGRLKSHWCALGIMGVAVIFFVILGTTSGSQMTIFVFIFASSIIFRPQYWKQIGLAGLLCSSIAYLDAGNVERSAYTMRGAGSAVMGMKDPANVHSGDVSLSVTGRLTDINDALSVLQSDLKTVIFGSFENTAFRAMDGQFLVFLYNSGIMGLLTFAGAAAFVYIRSLRETWKSRDDDTLALHLIVSAFGLTFLASRILMYFPFNFLFFLIAGLALTRSSAQRPMKVADTS